MKIYRCVSKKRYLHGKRVYEYERFYIPVPKRFHHIVKSFADKDVRIKVDQDIDGFNIRVQVCKA